MSFYNKSVTKEMPFGERDRATLYPGSPNLEKILADEASGKDIKRVHDIGATRGEMLVLGK